jgi:hypothetical protein
MPRFLLNSKILDPLGVNNMTGTAIVLSPAIETFRFDPDFLNFEIQWTGAPTGTLTLEGSNQWDPFVNPGVGFIGINAATLLNPAIPAITGASTYLATLLKPAFCRWVRWRYVNTSGTGQLSIWAFGKGRN